MFGDGQEPAGCALYGHVKVSTWTCRYFPSYAPELYTAGLSKGGATALSNESDSWLIALHRLNRFEEVEFPRM